MAQALGADLAHMDATEVAFFGDPQLMIRGILVNGRGQRYVNEDTYPGRIGQETLLRNENQAYLIIDEASYEEGCAADSSTPFFRFQPKWVAETVEELESDMGLPEGTLQSTVEVYNRHAARGEDGTGKEEGVGQADRLTRRCARSSQFHRRIHARRSAHVDQLGGHPRLRRTDPGFVCRWTLHRRRLRWRVCLRNVPRRRQLLRATRRSQRCQGLSVSSQMSASSLRRSRNNVSRHRPPS